MTITSIPESIAILVVGFTAAGWFILTRQPQRARETLLDALTSSIGR